MVRPPPMIYLRPCPGMCSLWVSRLFAFVSCLSLFLAISSHSSGHVRTEPGLVRARILIQNLRSAISVWWLTWQFGKGSLARAARPEGSQARGATWPGLFQETKGKK